MDLAASSSARFGSQRRRRIACLVLAKPIAVPDKVTVSFSGNTVTANGPKGSLSGVLPQHVRASQTGAELLVERVDDSREARSAHGLARTLVSNIVTGVSVGFTRNLSITGVGYRAESRGIRFILFHLGYSHPILFELPTGVLATVDGKAGSVALAGPDKQVLGAAAAEIRGLRPPEPYKGKGVRYSDEIIRRKEGKSGGKKGKK